MGIACLHHDYGVWMGTCYLPIHGGDCCRPILYETGFGFGKVAAMA